MEIVEQRVTDGTREIFDLDEFMDRRLFAHLATGSEEGPRESPVWFLWESGTLWIIGEKSFPRNLQRDPRCAVGVVDFDPSAGLVHHVGLRGTASVGPLDTDVVRRIFTKYMGDDEDAWDRRFRPWLTGDQDVSLVRIDVSTVVVRDQSYNRARHSTGSEYPSAS